MNAKDLLLRRRMMMEGRSPLPPPPDMSRTPLTFDILSDGNITMENYGNDPYVFEYSKNSGAWTEASAGPQEEDWAVIPVVAGDELRFRGTAWPGTAWCHFASTCQFSVKGNPYSLKYGDTLTGDEELEAECLSALFVYCEGLTSAADLALPATTLAVECYGNMFGGCTGLTTAPELPATTLAAGCYEAMFGGCTSLSEVKCYAEDISAADSTDRWVDFVAASGTFTKKAGVAWPSGESGIPTGWTVIEV